MERLKMCRICLATNVRMHNLVDTYLQEIYEELTAISLTTKDNRPVAACYICCARLRNCYQLRTRCLQSEKLLAKIMTSNGLEPPNQDASIINTLRISPVLHLSMGEDVVQNSLLQPVNVQLKRESSEIEVIVKREDPEDAENEFLQEYCITTLEDNKQPINPEDLLLDTANAESKSIITRLKFEDSPPTLQEARRNSDKNKIISFSSHAENDTLDDKKNCQVRNSVHDTNKPYKCNNCHKTYLSKNQLNCHLRVHGFKILYKCEICHKKYTAKHNLQRHMLLTHIRNSDKQTVEKPYQCDVCKKSFSGRSTLTKHYLVHSVEKPFICDKCDKGFKTKSHLNIHTRTHSGDRQYTCEVCNKSFFQRPHLNSHIRIHTGEKPFPCEICKENFRYKTSVIRHMSRVHKMNLVG